MTGNKTWNKIVMILVWGLIFLVPSLALGQGESGIPSELLEADCPTLRYKGLNLAADYFYNDETDLALSMIMYIEGNCGSDEPLRRIQILGSIWDGSFSEDLYDAEIINDLAMRADSENSDPRLSHFDAFTSDMADQLLPHVERQSLERFFCLFYAGRVKEAYALLQGAAIQDSDLKYYYEEELQYLESDRMRMMGGGFGSYWNPSGNLARLGNHAMLGAMLGFQYGDLFGRMNISFRLARSRYPYFVDYDGEAGWSDRTIGAKVTLDFGACFYSWGRHEVSGVLGGGIDVLQPFSDMDDYSIAGALAQLGIEYKFWLGQGRMWNLSCGVKREFYGHWHGEGSDLSGDAWDLCIGIGLSPGHGDAHVRREKLQYR